MLTFVKIKLCLKRQFDSFLSFFPFFFIRWAARKQRSLTTWVWSSFPCRKTPQCPFSGLEEKLIFWQRGLIESFILQCNPAIWFSHLFKNLLEYLVMKGEKHAEHKGMLSKWQSGKQYFWWIQLGRGSCVLQEHSIVQHLFCNPNFF